MALKGIQIRRAMPQNKHYTMNDRQGLSLRINPDGLKIWHFRFRFAAKARLMSFGSYDLVSHSEAMLSLKMFGLRLPIMLKSLRSKL